MDRRHLISLLNKFYYEGKVEGYELRGIGNIQFLLKWEINELIILIPGSNELADWLRNNIMVMRRNGTGFHSGYYEPGKLIAREVVKFSNLRRIEFAGHSMGGAIASIAGWLLRNRYDISVTTYGCPNYYYGKAGTKMAITNYLIDGDLMRFLPLWYGRLGTDEILNSFWYWNFSHCHSSDGYVGELG